MTKKIFTFVNVMLLWAILVTVWAAIHLRAEANAERASVIYACEQGYQGIATHAVLARGVTIVCVIDANNYSPLITPITPTSMQWTSEQYTGHQNAGTQSCLSPAPIQWAWCKSDGTDGDSVCPPYVGREKK